MYDTRRPYTLVNDNGIHQHFFRVPIADLELPGKVLEAVTAIRFGGDRPLAKITAGHLREVAENLGQLNGREADGLAADPRSRSSVLCSPPRSTTCLRHASTSNAASSTGSSVTSVPTCTSPTCRLLASPRSITSRSVSCTGFSVRSGIALGEWVRQQRLEACRRALADPGDARTITAIAHQWGFVDVTHFGRAFKSGLRHVPARVARMRTVRRRTSTGPRVSSVDVARAAEDASL